MAFPLATFGELLRSLVARGYGLGPVREFYEGYETPRIFLRHDVDRLPGRAVAMARAEHAEGVRSTYYFRCSRRGEFHRAAVRAVAELGHEVGFHYESPTRHPERALEVFESELAALRGVGPEVRTVAAHGAPLSARSSVGFAGRLDLSSHGLLGELSLDLPERDGLYVTDTGGVFGSASNLRDRTTGRNLKMRLFPGELASYLKHGDESLVLLNTHPERWPRWLPAVWLQRGVDGAANALKAVRRPRVEP